MKKIIITFFASIITLLSFGQANTYFHDRIDTTIFAVADTVGHGANNYYATNLTPDFNVRQYVNGFTVNLFFKKGNTGSATLTLITKTGTLSSKTIRKAAGQVLVSGDIPDSTAVILDYYNGSFRIAGIGVTASSSSWLLTGNAGTTAGTNFLGTTDAQDVVFKRNGSEAMRIYSSDKFIGIGTATPIYDLDITKAAAGAVGVQVANTTTSGVSNLVLGDGTNYSFLQRYGTTYGTAALRRALDIYTFDAGDIRFGTTNTERMRILSTGNVGIGITAPTASLHIKGSGATSATYSMKVQNSASADLFNVRDDGWLYASLYGRYMADGSLNMTNWLTSGLPAVSSNRNVAYGTHDSGIMTISGQGNTVIGSFASLGISGTRNVVISNIDIAAPTSGSNNILIGSGGMSDQTVSSCITFNGTASGTSQVVWGSSSYGRYTDWWFGQGKNISTASGRFTQNWYMTSMLAGQTDEASVGDWVFNASAGTGTGTGGDFVWKTAPAGSTGSTVNAYAEKLRLTSLGSLTLSGRLLEKQGTDVASSSTITITYTGNVFELTGTTAVNFITTTDWQEGSEITLIANENVTINDDAGGGNIRLAGNANFAMTADDVLTLVYSSTTAGGAIWREKSRSVN